MSYRDADAREEARAALARRLTRARELPDRARRHEEEREIFRELAALDLPRSRRSLPALPLLPRLRIASPCREPWDGMEGDARVRHCSRCERDVYDLSALSAREVEDLLRAHLALPEGGLPCVRFYRRADGTILTADCPSAAPIKHAALASTAAAAALVVSLASGSTEGTTPVSRVPTPPTARPAGSVHVDQDWGSYRFDPGMIAGMCGLGIRSPRPVRDAFDDGEGALDRLENMTDPAQPTWIDPEVEAPDVSPDLVRLAGAAARASRGGAR